MADRWAVGVQVILCTMWMTSQGALPQVGHRGAQAPHHSAGHGGPRETQQHHDQDAMSPAQQAAVNDKLSVDDISSLPGVHHEFKIDVGAGQSECFYQSIKQGAQLRVSFEVLRGADRHVDVIIKRPDGITHEKHVWNNRGNTDTLAEWEGDYEICIDNGLSRFSTKLVYLTISTIADREWQDVTDETEAFGVSLKYMQDKVGRLHSHVAKMLHLMGIRRKLNTKDIYLALVNNKTVQNMSVMLVIIFLVTSAIQISFLRYMFKTVSFTPTQKPRA